MAHRHVRSSLSGLADSEQQLLENLLLRGLFETVAVRMVGLTAEHSAESKDPVRRRTARGGNSRSFRRRMEARNCWADQEAEDRRSGSSGAGSGEKHCCACRVRENVWHRVL